MKLIAPIMLAIILANLARGQSWCLPTDPVQLGAVNVSAHCIYNSSEVKLAYSTIGYPTVDLLFVDIACKTVNDSNFVFITTLVHGSVHNTGEMIVSWPKNAVECKFVGCFLDSLSYYYNTKPTIISCLIEPTEAPTSKLNVKRNSTSDNGTLQCDCSNTTIIIDNTRKRSLHQRSAHDVQFSALGNNCKAVSLAVVAAGSALASSVLMLITIGAILLLLTTCRSKKKENYQ